MENNESMCRRFMEETHARCVMCYIFSMGGFCGGQAHRAACFLWSPSDEQRNVSLFLPSEKYCHSRREVQKTLPVAWGYFHTRMTSVMQASKITRAGCGHGVVHRPPIETLLFRY